MRRFLLLIFLFWMFGRVVACPNGKPDDLGEILYEIIDDDNVTTTTAPLLNSEQKPEEEPAPTQQPVRNINPVLYGGAVPIPDAHYPLDHGAPMLATWTLFGYNPGMIFIYIALAFCAIVFAFVCCNKKTEPDQPRRQQQQQEQNQQNQGHPQGRDSFQGYRTRTPQPVGGGDMEMHNLVDRQERVEEEVEEEPEDVAQEHRDQGPQDLRQDAPGAQEPGNQDPATPSTSTASTPRRQSERLAKIRAEAAAKQLTGAQAGSPTSSGSARSVVATFHQDTPETDL